MGQALGKGGNNHVAKGRMRPRSNAEIGYFVAMTSNDFDEEFDREPHKLEIFRNRAFADILVGFGATAPHLLDGCTPFQFQDRAHKCGHGGLAMMGRRSLSQKTEPAGGFRRRFRQN